MFNPQLLFHASKFGTFLQLPFEAELKIISTDMIGLVLCMYVLYYKKKFTDTFYSLYYFIPTIQLYLHTYSIRTYSSKTRSHTHQNEVNLPGKKPYFCLMHPHDFVKNSRPTDWDTGD